jgi:hypothetical protein
MWNRSVRFTLLTLALAVAIPAAAKAQTANTPAATPQVAQPPESGVDWSGVGIGAATVVADVVYVPTKVVYAILGGIGGGAGWALTGGNSQVSDTIWRSSLGGDYVLTPGMVRGDEPIHFSGPTETSGQGSGAAVPASSGGASSGGASSSGASSRFSSGGNAPLSVVPANSSASAQPIDGGAGPVHGTASADHGLGIE